MAPIAKPDGYVHQFRPGRVVPDADRVLSSNAYGYCENGRTPFTPQDRVSNRIPQREHPKPDCA